MVDAEREPLAHAVDRRDDTGDHRGRRGARRRRRARASSASTRARQRGGVVAVHGGADRSSGSRESLQHGEPQPQPRGRVVGEVRVGEDARRPPPRSTRHLRRRPGRPGRRAARRPPARPRRRSGRPAGRAPRTTPGGRGEGDGGQALVAERVLGLAPTTDLAGDVATAVARSRRASTARARRSAPRAPRAGPGRSTRAPPARPRSVRSGAAAVAAGQAASTDGTALGRVRDRSARPAGPPRSARPAAVSVAAADRVRSLDQRLDRGGPRPTGRGRAPDATRRARRRPPSGTAVGGQLRPPRPHGTVGDRPPRIDADACAGRRHDRLVERPPRWRRAASACACTASASSSTHGRSAASDPRSVRPMTVRARSGPGEHRQPAPDRGDDRARASSPSCGPRSGHDEQRRALQPVPAQPVEQVAAHGRQRRRRDPVEHHRDRRAALDGRPAARCHGSASPYRAAVVTNSHRSAASSSRWADSRLDSSTESRSGASSSAMPRGTLLVARRRSTDSSTGWCESSSASSGLCTSTGRRVVGRSTPAALTSGPTSEFTSVDLPAPVDPDTTTTAGADSSRQARHQVLAELVDEPRTGRPRGRRCPSISSGNVGALHVAAQVPDRVEQRRRRERPGEDVARVGGGMSGVGGRCGRAVGAGCTGAVPGCALTRPLSRCDLTWQNAPRGCGRVRVRAAAREDPAGRR